MKAKSRFVNYENSLFNSSIYYKETILIGFPDIPESYFYSSSDKYLQKLNTMAL